MILPDVSNVRFGSIRATRLARTRAPLQRLATAARTRQYDPLADRIVAPRFPRRPVRGTRIAVTPQANELATRPATESAHSSYLQNYEK
jgi:hypothetical protein